MDSKKYVTHSCDEWIELIQECRTSGLSDQEWCRQNGISSSTFYAAIKRCRKMACAIPEPTKFKHTEIQNVVPVTFSESITLCEKAKETTPLQPFGVIQVTVNDYKIQIAESCAKEVIKNTLLALKELC